MSQCELQKPQINLIVTGYLTTGAVVKKKNMKRTTRALISPPTEVIVCKSRPHQILLPSQRKICKFPPIFARMRRSKPLPGTKRVRLLSSTNFKQFWLVQLGRRRDGFPQSCGYLC